MIGLSLLAGLGVGGGLVAYAADAPPGRSSGVETTPELRMPDGRDARALTKSWPTNEYGLTFGTPSIVDPGARNLPDLIPRTTTGGVAGFVRATDFYPPEPKTTEEVVAYEEKLTNEKGEIFLDVYKADGKTPVGQALVGVVGRD